MSVPYGDPLLCGNTIFTNRASVGAGELDHVCARLARKRGVAVALTKPSVADLVESHTSTSFGQDRL